MPSWAELRDFEPQSLRAALATVEHHHRHLLEPPEPAEDQVEQLRALLAATPEAHIPALAGRLERSLLLAVPDLLATQLDEDLQRKAVQLGRRARLAAIVRRAWRLLVTGLTTVGLVRLLRGVIADGMGATLTSDEAGRGRLAAWLANDDLPVGLLNDLEERNEGLRGWVDRLPRLATPIDPESRLIAALRSRVLTHGRRASLVRFHDALLGWVEELARPAHASLNEGFAANYLKTLREGRGWQPDIVDWIVERFEKPDPDKPTGFWRRLDAASPGIIGEVASWLALRELEQFFDQIHDELGRFEFWRDHFGDRFLEVMLLADGQAALLRLPGVVVVEFGETGNAAYVYPESQLGWLKARRSPHVWTYKDKTRTETRPDARPFTIHHSGYWQDRASVEMNDLLRRRARRTRG